MSKSAPGRAGEPFALIKPMTKKRLLQTFVLIATVVASGCASSKDKAADATDHTHTHEVIQERHYYHPSHHHHRSGGTRVSPPDDTEIRGPGVGVGVGL